MAYPTAAQAAVVGAWVATYGAPARVVMECGDGPYARVMVVWPAYTPRLQRQPRVLLLEPDGKRVFFDPTPYDITT